VCGGFLLPQEGSLLKARKELQTQNEELVCDLPRQTRWWRLGQRCRLAFAAKQWDLLLQQKTLHEGLHLRVDRVSRQVRLQVRGLSAAT